MVRRGAVTSAAASEDEARRPAEIVEHQNLPNLSTNDSGIIFEIFGINCLDFALRQSAAPPQDEVVG
jgi:hypothetical protein